MSRPSYVCILSDPTRSVYLEVTKDPDVTLAVARSRSGIDLRLVHQEEFATIMEANLRAEALATAGEADILLLVNQANPEWLDLARRLVYSGSSGSDDPEGPDAGGVGAKLPQGPLRPKSGAAAALLPME